MTFLSLLLTVLKAVGMALGIYKEQHDQSIGAELQRGKDAQNELTRTTAAIEAPNDPVAYTDIGMRDDPNNRDNKQP
jgi:hypothetical protein